MRYWADEGTLPVVRGENHYRYVPVGAERRVAAVRRFQGLGFSLVDGGVAEDGVAQGAWFRAVAAAVAEQVAGDAAAAGGDEEAVPLDAPALPLDVQVSVDSERIEPRE